MLSSLSIGLCLPVFIFLVYTHTFLLAMGSSMSGYIQMHCTQNNGWMIYEIPEISPKIFTRLFLWISSDYQLKRFFSLNFNWIFHQNFHQNFHEISMKNFPRFFLRKFLSSIKKCGKFMSTIFLIKFICLFAVSLESYGKCLKENWN